MDNDRQVWRSNNKYYGEGRATLKLLNTGNLVAIDPLSTVLWSSGKILVLK